MNSFVKGLNVADGHLKILFKSDQSPALTSSSFIGEAVLSLDGGAF